MDSKLQGPSEGERSSPDLLGSVVLAAPTPAASADKLRTTRRALLVKLLGVLPTLVACTASRQGEQRNEASRSSGHPVADQFGHKLLQDLERLRARTYSEEGIAVWLVCENVILNGGQVSTIPTQPTEARLLQAFRRATAELTRLRAEATGEDLAKLIEVLADRDLGTRQSTAIQ